MHIHIHNIYFIYRYIYIYVRVYVYLYVYIYRFIVNNTVSDLRQPNLKFLRSKASTCPRSSSRLPSGRGVPGRSSSRRGLRAHTLRWDFAVSRSGSRCPRRTHYKYVYMYVSKKLMFLLLFLFLLTFTFTRISILILMLFSCICWLVYAPGTTSRECR